ncbi:dTMP kinase [Catenisphaera adipataccumulans]|jgi:dTMP kinase|uniref:Thymidylate kinase n=1 Tax=Catenisphaera adipataccumulans TaxID=700500 RepID=A0A7W8FW35_9FIRM|nr:dTMP kinase [Catenisphaera adipataccumulans]MBB5183818.1 dTMP kinase [Catenisphaera adipataccumulans]
MKKGVFITFEGNDGAGKTTVCKGVEAQLKQAGRDVLYTREPGGSRIAEAIRDLLLDPDNTDMDPRCEALLYAASRRQHLVEVILPALAEGKIVLCDRFIDSSLAYQGFARAIGIDAVYAINRFAIDDCMPDATIFLSVSTETGQKRMDLRGDKNRLDLENSAFHQKVRQGYEELIRRYPERITVIDAEPDQETVIKAAMQVVRKVVEPYE